ncbi:hypothetical protein HPB48_009572 [Haemaphysalis longicornis]|uniref:ATPase AAA-type core domain-containing protein n=1 Tax=Haemaphysalis longicornis TaxID=44386 RepID=A0A9J6FBD7_HAELO|nr:hypothetical protein HPB48_009572 [Haemaphysalis longicornis]
MADIPALVWNADAPLGEDVSMMSREEVICKTEAPHDQVKFIKSDIVRIPLGIQARKQKIRDNSDKIKANKVLPYLVSSIVELLDVDPLELGEENGASADIEAKRKGEGAEINSSTRQTYTSPFVGVVHADKLRSGLDKDSFVFFQTLPQKYDSRVEVIQEDERSSEQYRVIGDLEKQTQELVEAVAIVLPMTHKDTLTYTGISLLEGGGLDWPPETDEVNMLGHVRLHVGSDVHRRRSQAGERRVRPGQGEGARVIFTSGLDSIGNERFDSEKAGDRERQRTMLELLSLLDGLSSSADIVMVATDQAGGPRPALLRWCRQDWTMEFPHADKDAATRIMQVHSRKMK